MPESTKAPDAEATYPVERFTADYRALGRELGRPVTRGTVAGALHLLGVGQGGGHAHPPKRLSRSAMLAALDAYLKEGA